MEEEKYYCNTRMGKTADAKLAEDLNAVWKGKNINIANECNKHKRVSLSLLD